MKSHFVCVFCIVSLVIAVFSNLVGDGLISEGSTAIVLAGPGGDHSIALSNRRRGDSKELTGRTLLSHKVKPSARLVAIQDGTICLEDEETGRVFWSFSSGSPIYASYQASINQHHDKDKASEPSSGYFIDIGDEPDDWELYANVEHFGRVKLPMAIEDYIKSTPFLSEEGAVTLGSKRTSVFVINAETGNVIHTYRSSDSPSSLKIDEKKSSSSDNLDSNVELVKSDSSNSTEWRLHITRADYTLEYFRPNSDKMSWSLTVAQIWYNFLCQDVGGSFGKSALNSSYELCSEISKDFDLPLPCQSKEIVVRFKNQGKSEFSDRVVMLPLPASVLRLPSESKVDKSLNSRRETLMLPAPAPDVMLPSLPEVNELSNSHHNGDEMFALPPLETNHSLIVDGHGVGMPYNVMSIMFFEWSAVLVLFLVLIGFVIIRHVIVGKEEAAMIGQPIGSNLKDSPSRRKKIRKSGKNNGSFEKKYNNLSSENGDGFAAIEGDSKMLLDLNKLVDRDADGRRIGKLFVSNIEIAKGSNGTVVLEGIYEGRPVAVKRLVQTHHDVAFKEIQNLIASDQHPNIVRWYGVENDQDFVYLSLERCTCSLDDLIQIYSESSQNPIFSEGQPTRDMIEYKLRLDSVKDCMRDLDLWRANGYPSPLLLKLMRDVVSGLAHLHELGIIHRDLKPQNVLIIKERFICAKLSDMGISRRLLGNMSSLDHHATGCGSSGWQAPEQLLHGRQTRALDLFSLGCVLFFCITGGRHPFGDRIERDINIVKNQMDLFLVEHIPEAWDLISRLLNPEPELRPKALEALHHPLFWSSEMRLSFLRDTSDRVELEDRESNSDLLRALESIAPMALGAKWDEKMEPAFITNIGHYRRYRFDCVRDLLRVMRNKLNHYRELPKEIQVLVGSVPDGFDNYFASRFPRLFIEVYKVVCRYCKEEEYFQKYFKNNSV